MTPHKPAPSRKRKPAPAAVPEAPVSVAAPVPPRPAGPVQLLTQVEFSEKDFGIAERVARHLGYTQFVYTTTSDLWGYFCQRDSATDPKPAACIIKTRELGFLVVSDLEDLRLTQEGRRIV